MPSLGHVLQVSAQSKASPPPPQALETSLTEKRGTRMRGSRACGRGACGRGACGLRARLLRSCAELSRLCAEGSSKMSRLLIKSKGKMRSKKMSYVLTKLRCRYRRRGFLSRRLPEEAGFLSRDAPDLSEVKVSLSTPTGATWIQRHVSFHSFIGLVIANEHASPMRKCAGLGC